MDYIFPVVILMIYRYTSHKSTAKSCMDQEQKVVLELYKFAVYIKLCLPLYYFRNMYNRRRMDKTNFFFVYRWLFFGILMTHVILGWYIAIPLLDSTKYKAKFRVNIIQ